MKILKSQRSIHLAIELTVALTLENVKRHISLEPSAISIHTGFDLGRLRVVIAGGVTMRLSRSMNTHASIARLGGPSSTLADSKVLFTLPS